MLSQSDLDQRGTRFFQNISLDKTAHATAKALANLGYSVTQNDCLKSECMIKKAPVEIMAKSEGTVQEGFGTAYINSSVTRDGMSWAVSLNSKNTNDVEIVIRPRAFRNGSDISDQENVFVAEVMDSKFKNFWREFDDSLKMTK